MSAAYTGLDGRDLCLTFALVHATVNAEKLDLRSGSSEIDFVRLVHVTG